MKKSTHSSYVWLALPALLLVFGVLLSAGAAYLQYKAIEKNIRNDFERMAVRTEDAIVSRLNSPVQALRGGRGFFNAVSRVDRLEFSRFVLSRDLKLEFPGVRGLGFIERVKRDDVESFLAFERQNGAPDFAISQLNDKSHSELFVIKYIEPLANNKGTQGLDVGSESLRLAAIRQAINTGAPTVTGAITLEHDNKAQPGVILYLAVYRHGEPLNNSTQRNAALVG